MRKMFSKNQIKEIIIEAIQSGEIRVGANPKLIEQFNSITSAQANLELYKDLKLYAFRIVSANYSDNLMIGLLIEKLEDQCDFTTAAWMYDENGQETHVCRIIMTYDDITFMSDDGIITPTQTDELYIYEL